MVQSTNTAMRPSDAHPACPRCESDVFVDARDRSAGRYACHNCDEVFHV